MDDNKSMMEHVLYEIWMYLATYNGMNRFSECTTMDQAVIHNALWESHLIHLRAMLFFFDKPRANRDRRNIYIDNIILNTEGHFFTDSHDEVKSALSQTLAHLSYSRSDVNKVYLAEEVMNMIKEIKPLIYKFLVNIDMNIKDELKADMIENRGMIQEIVNELRV